MTKLKDIAKARKSKNAGPFQITFDVMFEDRATFDNVLKSGSLTAANASRAPTRFGARR